ncbi:PD-(D/E)XK nuclease family protein [Actinomyces vulturis]|uniref:PD-(D/E)XK nuclease family protein n=1 Tax=Actinomyces vulturis TaxID=1857645 RepID=UPI0008350B3D|nr:PD-(D/E)XK nuclease family protein [Actinomyces vulturis]
MDTVIDATLTGQGLVPGSGERTAYKLDKNYLSPSAMNALDHGCPASWAAGKLGPYLKDPMAANETGNVIHATMERLYSLEPSERNVANALVFFEEEKQKAFDSADVQYTRKEFDEHFAMYVPAIQSVFDKKYEYAPDVLTKATELKLGTFTDPVNVFGVPVYGVIDRLDQGENGLVMRDYKLRGIKNGKIARMPTKSELARFGDEYGHQQRVYVMAAKAAGIGEITESKLLYLATKQQRIIDLSEQAMADTQSLLQKTWVKYRQMVDGKLFEYKPSILCRWCPLSEICPGANGRKVGSHIFSDPAPNRTSLPLQAEVIKEEEQTMQWGEDKPFNAYTSNASINIASYGAGTAFGVVSLAWELISKCEEMQLTPTNVEALSKRLYRIITTSAQNNVGHKVGYNSGAITRSSGALRTFLETHTPPVGNEEDMDQWEAKALRAIGAMSSIAFDLIDEHEK